MAKKSMKLQNPFVLAEYVSPDYFCDRTEETEELIANLQNGRNTTLISPRRIGKTGLIRNAFYRIRQLEKDAICIYIDIFSTKNQHDFVQLLGTALAQYVLSYEQQALRRLLQFFGSWRPVFSADPVTGVPTVSVSIETSQTEMTLKTIFDYLKQSRHHIYIAIDEFQQITYYPETGTEALLRSYMQFAPNVHFIFSGSKQHLMAQINRFFETKKGRLSKDIFHAIYTQFDGVTANIQQILNRLYEQGKTIDNEQQVTEAIQHIINRSSMQYEGLLLFLTDNQLSLLKAIAKTDCVKSPQAGEFIRQYELPSASSVKTALTVLVDKDLVYHNADGYTIYDHFFALWLKQLI